MAAPGLARRSVWRRFAARRLVAPALALLLVALAALARFVLFDRIEFKYDEAQVAALALALVRRHVLPESSILTSGGFRNSPLFVYLIALPMLVSTSPYVLTGFVAALNALAAGGLYLISRRMWGDAAAVAAALLFALDPLAVHYARKIWAPDLMPPFTVLWFAGLLLALGEGRAWGLPLALLALAVLVQLHQAAAVLLPVTALLFAVFAPRLGLRRLAAWLALGVGLAAFVLLAAPYAAYEAQHGFADLRGIVGQVSAHPAWTAEPWLALWWLAAGWRPTLFFADLAAQERLTLAGATVFDWLVLALGVLGLAACLRWLWRPETPWLAGSAAAKGYRRVAGAALLLAVLAPPAAMSRTAAPILPHYLVFLSPLLALLVALGGGTAAIMARGAARRLGFQQRRPSAARGATGLTVAPGEQGETYLVPTDARPAPRASGDRHEDASPRPTRGALPLTVFAVVVGTLLVTAVVRQAQFDQALLTHQAGGDYGTPLNYSVRAADALRAQPRAFLMGANGDFLAVFSYLQAIGSAPPAAQVDPALALALPPRGTGAAYLFFGQTDSAAYRAMAAVGPARGNAAVPIASNGGGAEQQAPAGSAPPGQAPSDAGPAYTLLQLTPAQADRLDDRLRAQMTAIGPYRVGPGLALVAAALPTVTPSGPLDVRLAWRIDDPRPYAAQPVRMFVHLYDAQRKTMAQADSLGDPAAGWQAGDRLFTWFSLPLKAPLAPGRYTLVAGVYVVEGFRAFPVQGPKGEQLGGEIPLGAIDVRR